MKELFLYISRRCSTAVYKLNGDRTPKRDIRGRFLNRMGNVNKEDSGFGKGGKDGVL